MDFLSLTEKQARLLRKLVRDAVYHVCSNLDNYGIDLDLTQVLAAFL